MTVQSPGEVRLAEMVFVLSIASDLGMGQPLEHGLRTALIAARLSALAGLDTAAQRDVYYVALLHYAGCSAEGEIDSAFFGDEIAARSEMVGTMFGSRAEMARTGLRNMHPDLPAPRRAAIAARNAPGMFGEFRRWAQSHCEVAQLVSARFDLGPGVSACMGSLYERWDGRGFPAGSGQEEIPLAVRIMHVAQDAEIAWRNGGVDEARALVAARSGRGLDPDVATLFGEHAEALLAGIDAATLWDDLLAAEPGEQPLVPDEARLLDHLAVIADFADLKTTHTAGHSRAVSALAAAGAEAAGLPEPEVASVRQAGLVHDVGRVAISAAVWTKTGPLTRDEEEKARLAPYYTERILDRPQTLRDVARLAGSHQERCDGSGYHRGLLGEQLPRAARILAAADAYQSLTEAAPARPALSPDEAAGAVADEARAGRLDADAVGAVLAAAGHAGHAPRTERPAGITDREAEVLGLLARGMVTKQIGFELGISPKTADRHIQNIYAKIGMSTRAAATMFALQHGLVAT